MKISKEKRNTGHDEQKKNLIFFYKKYHINIGLNVVWFLLNMNAVRMINMCDKCDMIHEW